MDKYANLDDLICQFYQLALITPVADFKRTAFQLMADTLKADSGVWLTRAEQQIPFYDHDALTLNLPSGFMEDYHQLASVSQQVQQVFGAMLGHLGRTRDILDLMPEDEWLNSDMYRLYCEKYQLHHSLMTVSVIPENQLMHIVTLARHNPEHPFSEQDKQVKEFLAPALTGALRANLLSGFHTDSISHGRAVVDHYGNIIEADAAFHALAKANTLIRNGKLSLAPPLTPAPFELNGILFDVHSAQGLLYIQARNENETAMTQRQREVMCIAQQGLSNKAIASTLGISEATVKNHIKAILKATGSSSRQQLVLQAQTGTR